MLKNLRIEHNVPCDQAPFVGDEEFWNDLPSFTVPMALPYGLALAFNVKGPTDELTGQPKFVRFLRSYDIEGDTFIDRVDCFISPLNDCFKNPIVDDMGLEVTSESDETIVVSPEAKAEPVIED
jgi:hypothetical protein